MRASEPGDRVEQDHHVALVLDQPLGLLDDHVGHLDVALWRLVERRRDHLAPHGALHVGDLFWPLVDQEHDQVDLGVILGDGVGEILEQNGLARARGGHDQPALALADRTQEVHGPGGQVVRVVLETDPLHRVERREVVEEGLVARLLRRLEVDGLNFQEGEVALGVLGRPHLAGDGVAGAEVETADLGGRDVDVVGARQIVVVGGAEESEPVRQHFEHTLGEDEPVPLCLSLQDLEDQLLLAEAAEPLHAKLLGDIVQLGDVLVFEFGQVHPLASSPNVFQRTLVRGYSRSRRNALGATLRDDRLRGVLCTCESPTSCWTGLRPSICHMPAHHVNLILQAEMDRASQPDVDDRPLLDLGNPLVEARVVFLPVQDVPDLVPRLRVSLPGKRLLRLEQEQVIADR